MKFSIDKKDSRSSARAGRLEIRGINIETPVFMPVGTKATVKAISQRDLSEIGFRILLANTYHLYLRPGIDVIRKSGGLHRFMSWNDLILTDSGGFQVFSLSKISSVRDDGVEFSSIIDGSKHFFSPEMVLEYQFGFGSDIAMVLDECVGFPATRGRIEQAARRTISWAYASKRYMLNSQNNSSVFGIVQGGTYPDLRKQCAEELSELDFDGYAIGGLSVGEPVEMQLETLSISINALPHDKPRYFMGLGDAKGIIESIEQGVDMFDCVFPTRIARNGAALVDHGRINIKNSRYGKDMNPMDHTCKCYVCQNFSRAYIRHIFMSQEILALMMITYHNLYYLNSLMKKIRKCIIDGTFIEFKLNFLNNYRYDSNIEYKNH
jgi:queuine tRNA-ribosyltransferase